MTDLFCKDCQYGVVDEEDVPSSTCEHPSNLCVICGTLYPKLCKDMRDPWGACTHAGLLFVQKEEEE